MNSEGLFCGKCGDIDINEENKVSHLTELLF